MKKVALTLALLLATTGTAMAQGSGTVTVNGSVSSAASLRWWSFSAIGSATGSNAPATQGGPLDFTLDLGDVSAAANADNYTGGTVELILRSNNSYTLSAQVTASNGFAAGVGEIALSDIGVGIGALTNSGAGTLVSGDPANDANVSPGWASDPSAAVKDGDGIPTYANDLSDLAGAIPVLSGPRISAGGGLGSSNNGLLVETIYAVAPQLWNANPGFDATVTYTISSP